ncbi:40S ribosomal protein S12 [Mitosporidium daphniae]|uniref:40S ribosomal protein S12 n=1 Tax=Mitosporidium daphniae TaxID=1485682 RepID=A0A098VW01_9MICR|nr:40S ribosomal protein S12 [Mitosporidium daphniae]KGG53105.1 40S ribosomal protein S12 [Mitosporidium daphniae]|eukprot:XP_013239580.1 40S ribosomal protein S12 [Mitosporidium daphniae]
MSSEGDVSIEMSVVETTVSAEIISSMSIEEALVAVLRQSRIHNGLARGLRECVKALDRGTAHLCILAESCDEAGYVKLITALCAEHSIDLIKVPDGKKLGEWVGLCKYDDNGVAQKIVSCSSAVIRQFGEESEAMHVLVQHLKGRN